MTEVPAARSNRRRRVRHKVLTPAYASFVGGPRDALLDLNEIVDISEDGVAIQSASPLEPNRRFELCLDLAETSEPIYTAGRVIWSGASGRSGLRFSDLTPTSLLLLREWLFLNAMAGVANAQADAAVLAPRSTGEPVRPNYTDTLAALTAVEREVQSLGTDLVAALHLIAARAQTLLRAGGAAVALASDDPNVMVCRSSSGADAPPVGSRLQIGSGFSGECVRSGRFLRCDDAETDPRVDRESCRALGIRSILATPLRAGEKVIGLIEVFAAAPGFFTEDDASSLQRLADMVVAAVNRTARSQDATISAPRPAVMPPSAGSVLFASETRQEDKADVEDMLSGGIRLPRSQLIILVCAFAAISMALGFLLGPTIQEKLQARRESSGQTVLAASHPPVRATTSANPRTDAEAVTQLTELAGKGDPAAQYSLGMRYHLGDGVKQDYTEAARWFTHAADQGHVRAQAALGDYYSYGRGVPVDVAKSYFWSYLAFAGGDEVSKLRLGRLARQLPPAQLLQIQQQAAEWFHRHQKPTPAH